MSDTNAGLGMVPCGPKCRCPDCQLERAFDRAVIAERKLAAVTAERDRAREERDIEHEHSTRLGRLLDQTRARLKAATERKP